MMHRPTRSTILGYALIALLAVASIATGAFGPLDRWTYDLQTRWLYKHASSPLVQDVVVIGVDEAAFEAINEPFALWHRQLGDLLTALSTSEPAVVGLAVPLPVRSYDYLIKGIEQPLIDGINRLNAKSTLIVGQTQGLEHHLRPISPTIRAALKDAHMASLSVCEDVDGIVRSVASKDCTRADPSPPFALALSQAMGRSAQTSGRINHMSGGPISYIPFTTALAWAEPSKLGQLQSAVRGRAVIIASVLPSDAQFRLPVAIAAWDQADRTVTADVVHVQILRSLLGRGMVESASLFLVAALALAVAGVWFGGNSRFKFAVVMAFGLALGAWSTFLLWHGTSVPTGSLLFGMAAAYTARLAWDAVRQYQEKALLKSAFAGHVSPTVMRAILKGKVQPDGDGEKCLGTVMFSDIRGFTTRSENSTPESMIWLLNRYYAEATAAIHGHGGAIDKFIGDGLMATFGVLQPLATPERNALEAAQDLLVRIQRLNGELAAQGLAPIEIGVGIHRGDVLAGYVGSRKRRDFTVIGDTVNTASRLEGMTKSAGYPVVCSHEVAAAVGFAGDLVDLGEQSIKGRSALRIWGWNPPLTRIATKA